MGAVVAGLDVGGTKVLGRVLDPGDPTVALVEHRVPTPRGEGALLDALTDVVATLAADPAVVAAGGLVGVGVGLPGLVGRDGALRFGPNLPGVEEVAVAPELARRTGLAVVADNDANCAMWCEVVLGAASGASHALLVTLGTGIGGGIVVEGELLQGASGFAAEPGHMVVDPAGPWCPCGRRGCWERFASGSGLGRLGRDAAVAGRADQVVALAGGDPLAVRGDHVTRAALDGDPGARAIVGECAWWLAQGLANLVNLFDPEVVVIGGGLANLGDVLIDPTREAFAELVLGPGHRPAARIVGARFGPEAGAIGAGLLARPQ